MKKEDLKVGMKIESQLTFKTAKVIDINDRLQKVVLEYEDVIVIRDLSRFKGFEPVPEKPVLLYRWRVLNSGVWCALSNYYTEDHMENNRPHGAYTKLTEFKPITADGKTWEGEL